MISENRAADNSYSGVSGMKHIPVMCREAVACLAPRNGEVYIDGTFGAGGYTRRVLESADCKVLAIDRDPDAIEVALVLSQAFPGRLFPVNGIYSDMRRHAESRGFSKVSGIVLDLGVSSMQLDEADRGFSFLQDGPLDMRMGKTGVSAADIVNQAGEVDLANILFLLGEEHSSRAVARAIVSARAVRKIHRTAELASIVSRALGGRKGSPRHPATRTFQALRIYVNQELEELQSGLMSAAALLNEGGRLVVVTFHSLEDRIVKRFFALMSGKMEGSSRHRPLPVARKPRLFQAVRACIVPEESEIFSNPRARSARLRSGLRSSENLSEEESCMILDLHGLPPLSSYKREELS